MKTDRDKLLTLATKHDYHVAGGPLYFHLRHIPTRSAVLKSGTARECVEWIEENSK